MDLINIVNDLSKANLDSVFVYPNIPGKKIDNLMSNFRNENKDEIQPVILIDDTFFGSGKDGVLFSNDALYIHESFKKPKKIMISDIKSFSIYEKKIIINGETAITLSIPNNLSLLFVSGAMDRLLKVVTDKLDVTEENYLSQENKTMDNLRLEPDDYNYSISIFEAIDNPSNKDLSNLLFSISNRHMWDVYSSSKMPTEYKIKYSLAYDLFSLFVSFYKSSPVEKGIFDEGDNGEIMVGLVAISLMSFVTSTYLKETFPLTNDDLDLFRENIEIALNACGGFSDLKSNMEYYNSVSFNTVSDSHFKNIDITTILDGTCEAIDNLTASDIKFLSNKSIKLVEKWFPIVSGKYTTDNSKFIYGWRDLLCTSPLNKFSDL